MINFNKIMNLIFSQNSIHEVPTFKVLHVWETNVSFVWAYGFHTMSVKSTSFLVRQYVWETNVYP